MSQGVAILIERIFARTTGRKVQGPLGMAWTYLWLGVLGTLTVSKTWCVARAKACAGGLTRRVVGRTTLGLFGEIPDVSHWAWPRFVVPLMCLAPSTVATK